MTPAHIVLLGDSIFDNGAYTDGGPDVLTQLKQLLPRAWSASSLAVDGSTITDLRSQLARVPKNATHLAIAIGGNDALRNRHLLNTPVSSTAEALVLFGRSVAEFEAAYRAAVGEVARLRMTAILCTIYNGNLELSEARLARTALALFDDAILRVAIETGMSAIELRLVCTEARDYANPIEPSVIGGGKIARAIAGALGFGDSSPRVSHIYAD